MSRVTRKSNIKNLIKSLSQSGSVKVGFFENAIYPNGTPVAQVAALQEFGSPSKGVPPRSFMRSTIAEKQDTWRNAANQLMKQVVNGGDLSSVFETVGLLASGDIRKKISEIKTPPLADNTIKSRQSKLANGKKVGNLNKPLVETGIMLASVNYQVES